ncbi:hypothetical protein [Leptospira ilyithenensis]|uniref:Leucine-rich repeat domain-containing protein n=1 Tax=Leptospira ilyithenensis TaxID=2484901 RepID=A0A4R9LLV1_9LEPT|nr:hypothetical protein [Leptospira ilyithenensis]TGN09084.1 hypothetical protein EHS11_13065 [Leptospira ilyithenensis]
MKKIILIFNLLIVLNACSAKQTSDVKTNSDVEDLRQRGYTIDLIGDKGSKTSSHMSSSKDTKILSGDLTKICKIEKLYSMRFEDSQIPNSFDNEINNCDLSGLTLFRFFKSSVTPSLLCSFAKIKNFPHLSLMAAGVNDLGLDCLTEMQSIGVFDLTGANNTYTDEGFCKFAQSGIKIKTLYMYDANLTQKGYECLAEIQGIETMSFKRWKNFSKQEMSAVKDFYFKKHGKKIVINVFEYDKL